MKNEYVNLKGTTSKICYYTTSSQPHWHIYNWDIPPRVLKSNTQNSMIRDDTILCIFYDAAGKNSFRADGERIYKICPPWNHPLFWIGNGRRGENISKEAIIRMTYSYFILSPSQRQTALDFMEGKQSLAIAIHSFLTNCKVRNPSPRTIKF